MTLCCVCGATAYITLTVTEPVRCLACVRTAVAEIKRELRTITIPEREGDDTDEHPHEVR